MAEKSVYATNRKQRPITVPQLHHATFMTMDVDKMVSWYEKVVGMQPVFYAEHAAWLTNDEANHRIALLRLPGTKPPVDKPHSAGLHHTAFEYKTFDMWIDNYARLAEEGIEPELALHHGMTMSLYYVDPDGNGVHPVVRGVADGMDPQPHGRGEPLGRLLTQPVEVADQVGAVLGRAAGRLEDGVDLPAYDGVEPL